MKKALLLVALFLVGAATQTMANHQTSVDSNPIKRNGCNHADEVKFLEQGVIYTIATDGSFDYEVLKNPRFYKMQGKQSKFDRRRAKHIKRRNYRPFITTDRFGRIRSINDTQITYKKNGKVKTVGNIFLQYRRGLLTQIGNMELVYNRNREVKHTIGHVNKFNKKFWHDDWYVYNDQDDNTYYGRRIRTK